MKSYIGYPKGYCGIKQGLIECDFMKYIEPYKNIQDTVVAITNHSVQDYIQDTERIIHLPRSVQSYTASFIAFLPGRLSFTLQETIIAQFLNSFHSQF